MCTTRPAVVAYNLRFPGQYFDSETGKHYNYYRDYDASTGRYIESDPVGLYGGLNTYAYVDGGPLQRTDPRGLNWAAIRGAFWVGGRIGGAINAGIGLATGSSLGVLIYNACHSKGIGDADKKVCDDDRDWEEKRCDEKYALNPAQYRGCRRRAADNWAACYGGKKGLGPWCPG